MKPPIAFNRKPLLIYISVCLCDMQNLSDGTTQLLETQCSYGLWRNAKRIFTDFWLRSSCEFYRNCTKSKYVFYWFLLECVCVSDSTTQLLETQYTYIHMTKRKIYFHGFWINVFVWTVSQLQCVLLCVCVCVTYVESFWRHNAVTWNSIHLYIVTKRKMHFDGFWINVFV